ncbi:MAG TPA: NUDIX domain-containing protein [Gaiellaceae bacterium]|nr:NUDIX domain-containing protein [Gaiellaceae bacterium]
MRREFSAGVVLVRRMHGRWWFAAVRPQGKREGTWALPKGLVDPGEAPAETALREGFEETGVEGRLGAKLGDVRYVYTWDGERVFKVVSFFLAHARRGRVGALPPGMDIEIAEARWLPLDRATTLLAYRGERDMAARALEGLSTDPL